jgi:hypothetical protein
MKIEEKKYCSRLSPIFFLFMTLQLKNVIIKVYNCLSNDIYEIMDATPTYRNTFQKRKLFPVIDIYL